MAPFDATIIEKTFPYRKITKAYNDGLYIEGTGNAAGIIAHFK